MTATGIDPLLQGSEGAELQLEGSRYTVVGRLGRGGMATVYRAWDRRLGVWRAIKLLAHSRAQRTLSLDRFEREARILARLDHPGIVRVYDLDWHQGLPYIAMELIEGGSLFDWLERHERPLPPRDAVMAAITVCEGLAVAHRSGVIHRDVKPNNVLIGPDGCKLTDFGIALLEGGGREARGARLGTTGFAAPEQDVDAGRVDARADLYGLGATLYATATRRRPRDLHEADVDPSRLGGLPRVLRPIVQRACAYDPRERYPDAEAMLDELESVLPRLPQPDEEAPPLFEPQFSDPGFAGVPTGPSPLARVRAFRAAAITEPMLHVRLHAGPDEFEDEPPSLTDGWATEAELRAGTAGFVFGAALIGVAGALIMAFIWT